MMTVPEEGLLAAPPRSGAWLSARRPWLPPAVVAATVALALTPYLSGALDANPMLEFSGIATHLRQGLLAGMNTIDPNAGVTAQALGHRAALDWFSGKVPWWNPFEGLGAPLAGEMQSMALFVPVVLLLGLANGQMLVLLVFNLISALATYFLLRRLSISEWISAGAAVAFGLNGTVAWLHNAAANPVCFLPLLLLGIELAREAVITGPRRALCEWWMAGAAVALSIYAGFPETAYLDGILAAVWTLARLPGLGRRRAGEYLLRVGVAAVGGILLAAPALASFADYLSVAYTGPHGAAFAHSKDPTIGLSGVFFPYVFGPIFGQAASRFDEVARFWDSTGGFLTLALVSLALVGLIEVRMRGLRLALGGSAVFLLGRAFGLEPFVWLINLLPGMKHVAANRYGYADLELAVVVLAALGAEGLRSRELGRRHGAIALGAAAGLALLATEPAWPLLGRLAELHQGGYWVGASLGWGLFTLVMLGFAVVWPRSRFSRVVLAGLVPLEAFAMFLTPELSSPRGGQTDTALVAFLTRYIGDYRFFSLGPIAPDYGSYFALNSLGTNDLPDPKAFNNLIQSELDPNADAITFTGTQSDNPGGLYPGEALVVNVANYENLGVKYVVAGIATSFPWPVVYQDSVARVYQLPDPRPYFSLSGGECTIQRSGTNSATIDCSTPAILTREEIDLPGWSATVDGKRARIVADGSSLQEVSVPAGPSTVKYGFEPPHMALAVAAALVGAVVLAAPAIVVTGKRRRRYAGQHGRGTRRRIGKEELG